MRSQSIIRRVDKLGRITLPSSCRRALNIEIDDPLEIAVEGQAIVLKKAVPTCVFCGTDDRVQVFRDRFLCPTCLHELKNLK